jgi:D-glycero-D-manno-heptose 1,7-bisphosphate phosphatase
MSLYIFDKDGTLVKKRPLREGVMRTPTRPEEQVLIEGVFETLASLRAEGHILAMASNQSAVADGIITMEQAEELMANCAAKVGGMNAWLFCPYKPKAKPKLNGHDNPYCQDHDWRKPHPGMLIDLMNKFGFPAEDTFMIGDSKKDRKAAENAGVRFILAKEFFKYT